MLYHDLQIELAGNTKVPISHVTSHVLESVPSERLVVTEQQKRQQLLLGQVIS